MIENPFLCVFIIISFIISLYVIDKFLRYKEIKRKTNDKEYLLFIKKRLIKKISFSIVFNTITVIILLHTF